MNCAPLKRKTLHSIVLLLLFSAVAVGQEIKVMCSGAFSTALKQLAPAYEKSKGGHVEMVWGPSMGTTPGAIPVRLAHGEAGDVVIMARPALDALVQKGLVVKGSEVDLVRSRIGMAVRAGAAVPDISTVAAFRRVLLEAKSVVYSDSASGVYIANEMFKRLGIEKEMAGKSRQIPAEPIGLVLARGEGEIGFQQLSELKPIAGITVVGPIPDDVQLVTVFSAGIVANAPQPDQGRAFVHYLSSTQVCGMINETALEPVACDSNRKAMKSSK